MIIVTSLRHAPEQVTATGATKVISILSPDTPFPDFESVTGDNHLRLSFHDVAAPTPGLAVPGANDMLRLLTFIRGWDRSAPLLIHCWAGISRSTASAYIASCMLHPQKSEDDLAHALRRASPSATPNPMLIKLADDALGRDGKMRSAIAAIGRGANAFEGAPFKLDV